MKPTPELIEKIVNCMKQSAGRTPVICAGKFGVNPNTFNRWMKEGAKEDCGDPALQRLFLDINACTAEQSLELLDTITQHTQSDWKAADRLLNIKQPELDPKRVVKPEQVALPQSTNKLTLEIGDVSSLLSLITQFVRPESLAIDENSVIDVEEVVDDE